MAKLATLALAALALGLRLFYLFQSAESPFFDTPVVDARSYTEYARQLAAGSWAGRPMPFWQAPFYPYFLGILFSLFEENYYLPRLLQALAGTATCLVILQLGRKAFSPKVGWLAALGAAVYGPFLYFEGELLPTSWAVLIDAVLLLLLLWAGPQSRFLPWLIAGLVLGLGALIVPNVLLFAPVAIWWSRRFRTDSAPGWGRLVGAFALGLLLTIGPVTLRNRLVGEEWTLISFNVGINFYLGNNSDYDHTVTIRPGEGWRELVDLPEHEAGITQPGAGSRYFLGKSWDYMKTSPGDFLTLLLRKTYLFWQGAEIPRNLDPYFATQYSSLLRLLLWEYGLAFPFGLVSALALLGATWLMIRSNDRSPATDLILLFTLTYMLSVVLFFITGRYRLPAVPCLLILAAYGACTLATLRQRPLYLSAGALVLLLVATNSNAQTPNNRLIAFQHYSLAAAYESKGMETNALQHYRSAVESRPDHGRALLGLASMYGMGQRYNDAAATWHQYLHYYPEQDNVRLQLADLLSMLGKHPEALKEYHKVLSAQPDRALLHSRLGRTYTATGEFDQAEAHLLRAIDLDPDSTLAYYPLAQLYERREQNERAEQTYQQLLVHRRDHLAGLCHLADLLLRRGAEDRAAGHLKQALDLDPDNLHALRSTGKLEANQGQYKKAIQRFQRILKLNPQDLQARRSLAHLLLKTGQQERADAEYELYQQLERQRRMKQQTIEKTQDLADEFRRQFRK